MEKRLILMLGLPGSGKSTYVRNILVPQGVQVVSPDAIRLAHGHVFYAPLETSIHAAALLQARQHMLQGLDVVVDECNCRVQHLAKWKRKAEAMGYVVSCIFVNTPKEVCVQRRSETPGFPLEVIDRMDSNLSYDWPHITFLFPTMITVTTYEPAREHEE